MKKEPVKPVKTESRTCFGLVWFTSEDDATKYAAFIKERGDTYNGGWFHGMECGRDTAFDYVDKELGQLYAVSTA